MTAILSPIETPLRNVRGVGGLLRDWRVARRMSQLRLSLEARVSARHLSFLETGRAQPSREMVCRLAEVLDVPLRERNALLLAAGYAPAFHETPLEEPQLVHVRRALEFILAKQEPYPAFAFDRRWNHVLSNCAARAIFGQLLAGAKRHGNIMRQVFDPESLRPRITNWNEVAGELLRLLRRDVAVAPQDSAARALLDEILAYPDVPMQVNGNGKSRHATPLLTTAYRLGDRELRFFSTITTFDASDELTVAELRIECAFPADEATDLFCRQVAGELTV